MYEKFDPMLHSGANIAVTRGAGRRDHLVSMAFIKKYVHYAKSRIRPVLTAGAADHIVTTYAALRNDDLEGNQRRTAPLTARTLETLIRLATAHAKARLSTRVERRDADVAETVLRFALFKEVVTDERRKRRKTAPGALSSDESSSGDDSDGDGAGTARRTGRRRDGDSATPRATPGPQTRSMRNGTTHGTPTAGRQNGEDTTGTDQVDDDDDDDDLYTSGSPLRARTGPDAASSQFSAASSLPASQLLQGESQTQSQSQAPAVSADRLRLFQTALGRLVDTPLFANDAADVEPLVGAVNARLGGEPAFDEAEAELALTALSEQNKIM